MNTFPSSEKPLHLISLCIGRSYVSVHEIANYFNCSLRQASRIMDKLRDMEQELCLYHCDLINGDKGLGGDPKRIKITLDRKYTG